MGQETYSLVSKPGRFCCTRHCLHGWLRMDALFSERLDPCMLCSWIRLNHGCHHGWAMRALFSKRIKSWMSSWLGHETVDIIMVGPWMLCSRNSLGRHQCWAMDALFSKRIDHGRHHGWVMDALFSERVGPWTSWLGHGPWMFCAQKLDHGHHHGWAVVALFSERIRGTQTPKP